MPATSDLSGIGMLSTSLMQSKESDSYLSNSSVAKTAASKRRNISIGVAQNAELNNIQRPNIENTYDGSNSQA